MREIDHDELALRIEMTLASAPRYAVRAMGQPRRQIALHLMKYVFGNMVVLAPDILRVEAGNGPIHGKFGVTEPHPLDQLRPQENGPT